jgi:CheY-like chemotaxis protein
VLLAEGGADALRILGEAESGVCLVMMDMTMPGMNGEEAFARLREISDRLPGIFMSGYTAREKVSSVLDDPVTTFLQKPFSPAELQEALRQVFARQEAVFPLESGEAIEP